METLRNPLLVPSKTCAYGNQHELMQNCIVSGSIRLKMMIIWLEIWSSWMEVHLFSTRQSMMLESNNLQMSSQAWFWPHLTWKIWSALRTPTSIQLSKSALDTRTQNRECRSSTTCKTTFSTAITWFWRASYSRPCFFQANINQKLALSGLWLSTAMMKKRT